MAFSDPDSLRRLLEAEHKKLEAIFYGVESPLVIFRGPELVLEMFNEKYRAIYPGRELLGKPLLVALPELKDSIYPAILKKVYETGEYFMSHEGLARIRNVETGQLEDRYFDTAFSRIYYGEGEAYRIIATPREVTERVRARRKIEESLRELQQEREFRERFISALTHDLRTPLNVVLAGSQILKRRAEEAELVRALADRMLTSMEQADRMIRDLLDANRIKAGKGLPVSIQAGRLDSIVAQTVGVLEQLHGRRFTLWNPVGRVDGYWDSLAVQRIIENLAVNAIKYGDPVAPVAISVATAAEWIEIAVHNRGKSIPVEERGALFDPYHRCEAAVRSEQKGWGMGLAIVKGLVEAHRGTVRVESDAKTGTTFFVRLPIDARGEINRPDRLAI